MLLFNVKLQENDIILLGDYMLHTSGARSKK